MRSSPCYLELCEFRSARCPSVPFRAHYRKYLFIRALREARKDGSESVRRVQGDLSDAEITGTRMSSWEQFRAFALTSRHSASKHCKVRDMHDARTYFTLLLHFDRVRSHW